MKARQPLLRLYLENRRYIPGLALILLISLLAGGLKLAASTLWGQAVDFGVAGRISPMLWAAGAMTLVILVDCARTAVHYHIIGRVTETMFRDVRMKAFRKLTTGDAATLERDFRTGDTATRLNSDIDVLNNFTAGHVSNFSRLLFQGVVALAGCLFLSWQMSLAYLVVLPLSLWIVKRVSAPIQAKTKSSLDSTGAAMSVAAEAIQGTLTVKAFGAEEELARRFDTAVDSATQEEVESAAKEAGIHSFIQNLPQGYATPVGEAGGQLSGGQRQRVAIARALLKGAPILLLDEATAALDSQTEREIQQCLDQVSAGRTTVTVAHRLSTIENAHRVLVMEEGRVVEEGAFHQLLEQPSGRFRALYESQQRK